MTRFRTIALTLVLGGASASSGRDESDTLLQGLRGLALGSKAEEAVDESVRASAAPPDATRSIVLTEVRDGVNSDSDGVHGVTVTGEGEVEGMPSHAMHTGELTLLTEAQYKSKGAVCLDGGPPGFYYTQGKKSSDGTASTNWVLYFVGGGWCTSKSNCRKRAQEWKGTSSMFPKRHNLHGIFSAEHNPVLAGYNHVIFWYCDGGSFSGDVDDPVDVDGTQIYFRGRRILDAFLDVLLDPDGDYKMNTATQVLLTGCSAGGLATYINADHVGRRLRDSVPNLQRYKAAPISGWFQITPKWDKDSDAPSRYYNTMKDVSELHESQLNQGCIEAGNAWRCIFANYSYAYSETPMFLMQSSMDWWNLKYNLMMKTDCAKEKKNQFVDVHCTAHEIQSLNNFSHRVKEDIQHPDKSGRTGEGGFIHSCDEHCAVANLQFLPYAINGHSIVDAFNQWWLDDEGGAPRWSWPCDLLTHPELQAPNMQDTDQCNPSCF